MNDQKDISSLPDWSLSWMFVETRGGHKGSLRGIGYADPPLAIILCPNRHHKVEMPGTSKDGPIWKPGDEIACPQCGEPAQVLHAFWHEPYAWIEWYKEAGAGDYIAVEHDDGGAMFRPVSWRPIESSP